MYATKNLETQLVPFKMDGNNYNMWSKQFIMVVTPKGKLGYLNGNEADPDVDLYLAEHKKWITNNVMVHSWILNGLKQVVVNNLSILKKCKHNVERIERKISSYKWSLSLLATTKDC